MNLFYVRERIEYLVAHGDMQCPICFLPPEKDQLETRKINTGRLYFVSDPMLQNIVAYLRKINKTDVISLASAESRKEIFGQTQFPLCISDMCDDPVSSPYPQAKIEGLKKKDRIRIAILVGNDDHPAHADHLAAELDMLHRKLSAVFLCVEIDVYCHRLPRDFSAYLSVSAVTNIDQMPAGLNKLMQYDLYADLTEIEEGSDFREGLASFLEALYMPAQAAEGHRKDPFKVTSAACRHPEELVSVIIPTHNRSGLLRQAVESVLNQTHRKLELLIVDDGSTDDSKKVIEEYAGQDRRVIFLQQENAGVSAARNRGISSARGKYLLFLDDDMLLPHALQKMLSFLKSRSKDVKLVYGDAFRYHQHENRKVLSDLPSVGDKPGLYLQFLMGNPILSVFVLVEKKAVLEAGMFDPRFICGQDFDLWMKIILKQRIAKLRIPVALYRVHEAQRVSNRARVRYYSDCVALKLLQAIEPGELFPEKRRKEELANALEGLARSVLRTDTAYPHLDTALEIVRLAQREYPTGKRQAYITYLEREIPVILKDEFDSELRATNSMQNYGV